MAVVSDPIIQKVGVEADTSGLDKLGAQGESVFAKLQKAASNFAKADFGRSIQGTAEHLNKVEAAATRFGTSIRSVGSSVSNFGSNIGRAGVTAAKYGTIITGLVAIASRFATASSKQTDESAAARKELQLDTSASEQSQITALNNAKAHRDLFREYASGNVSITEFSKQVAKLNTEQREEAEIARQTALIRSREQEERIRTSAILKKEADERQRYNELVRTQGSETANALIKFGFAWEQFMTKFNAGPSIIADIISGVADFIRDNGTEIVDTFNKIGDAFAKIFDDGTGKSASFGEATLKAFRNVSDFILNAVIPAFKTLLGIFNSAAEGINAVFGTKLSGAGLAIIAVIGGLSGAFGILFAIVKLVATGLILLVTTFTGIQIAIGILIAIIAIGLVKALAAVDWAAVAAKAKAAWDAIVSTLAQMWAGVKVIFNEGVMALQDIWRGLGIIVKAVLDGIVTVVTAIWVAITTAFQTGTEFVAKLWTDAVTLITDAWNGLFDWFNEKIEALIGWFKKAVRWALELIGAQEKIGKTGDGGGSGGKTQALARGGSVRGPGTGTSDSILARLSRGEYVVKARAVSKYGIGLLSAINNMRFRMPKFATGGFVDAMANAIPTFGPMRFAEGGVVPSQRNMRPLALTLPGGGTFNMEADDDTAQSLIRYATVSTMRSAGRRPGWNR